MKRSVAVFLISLFSLSAYGFSQGTDSIRVNVFPDIKRCKSVVSSAFYAMRTGEVDSVYPFLSSSFSFMEYEGEMAVLAMGSVIRQVCDTVFSYELLQDSVGVEEYGLTYSVLCKEGKRFEIGYVFDTLSLLRELKVQEVRKESEKKYKPCILFSDEPVTVVPLRMMGNIITVKAKVNGVEGTYILDNGSPLTVINSYQVLKVDSLRKGILPSREISDLGTKMDVVVLDSFEFAGQKFYGKDFPMMDMQNLSEGMDIMGMIGYDFLRRYDWLVDYGSEEIWLIDPAYTESYLRDKGYVCDTLKLEKVASHVVTVEMTIDGQSYRMGLDLGAGSNLMDIRYADRLMMQMKNVRSSGDGNGVVSSVEPFAARASLVSGNIRRVNLGAREYKNVETVFTDISGYNQSFEKPVAGLIGHSILSRQKFLVSHRALILLLVQ